VPARMGVGQAVARRALKGQWDPVPAQAVTRQETKQSQTATADAKGAMIPRGRFPPRLRGDYIG
jgi:hypothetical protein